MFERKIKLKHQRKKAQMSLEMVIGLLILLVVAAVVIKIFLGSVGSIGTIDDLKKSNEYNDFKNQCDALCSQYLATNDPAAAAKYCSKKFGGASSLAQSAINKPIESDTKPGVDVCPNAIYCFMAKACTTDSGPIDWGDCKNILCQTYYNSYGDYGTASLKVQQIVPNAGSCTIPISQTSFNWYDHYGYTFPACGGIINGQTTTTTTTSSSTSPTLTCNKDCSTCTSITCNWSCPNNLKTGQYRVIVNQQTQQLFTSTAQSGSNQFTGLTSGTSYRTILTCDMTDATIYILYSITI